MHDADEKSPEDAAPPKGFSKQGMVVKLVLLPASVVLLLVLAVVGFRWLLIVTGVIARPVSSDDVDSLVDDLEQEGNTRWRAAYSLARTLSDPQNNELKKDPALAGRLAEILERELASGSMVEDRLTLRVYLCQALGKFHVADPLPVLIKAARTERDETEVEVRCSAIEALAVLTSNVGPDAVRSDPELLPVLLKASEDRRAPVRLRAAFTLGVVGGPQAEARLEQMLQDGYPDARYNAATGLARHGNTAAVDVLLEMLDPNETAGVDVEQQESNKPQKRVQILRSGLEATRQLAAADPSADTDRLQQAVGRLTQADVPEAVRVKAVDVLSQMKRAEAGSQ